METLNVEPRREGEPETVTVFGAGIQGVNGIYQYAGRHLQCPSYTMSGIYKEENVLYKIQRCEQELTYWKIWIDGGDILYFSDMPDECNSPPMRAWYPLRLESSSVVDCPPALFWDEEKYLDWRLDPAKSHSDCEVIVIQGEDSNHKSTMHYHIHKTVVMFVSEPLAAMLCWPIEELVSPDRRFSATIHLERVLVQLFPCLLDSIYEQVGPRQPVKYTLPLYCSPLLHLADYFQVNGLVRAIIAGMEKLMTADIVDLYLNYAFRFNIPSVIERLARIIASSIDSQNELALSKIAKEGNESFILLLLQEMRARTDTTTGQHQKASTVVANFLKFHPITAEKFREMTDQALLPAIDPNAAWILLELEQQIFNEDKNVADLSCLQERCCRALHGSGSLVLSDFPIQNMSRAVLMELFSGVRL
jgi:hypothetical protein